MYAIRQWEIFTRKYTCIWLCLSLRLSVSLSLSLSLCVCLTVSLFSPHHTKITITTHTSKLQTSLSVNNPAFSGSCAHFFTERERERERERVWADKHTKHLYDSSELHHTLAWRLTLSLILKLGHTQSSGPRCFRLSPLSMLRLSHTLSLSLSLSLSLTHTHTHTHTHTVPVVLTVKSQQNNGKTS